MLNLSKLLGYSLLILAFSTTACSDGATSSPGIDDDAGTVALDGASPSDAGTKADATPKGDAGVTPPSSSKCSSGTILTGGKAVTFSATPNANGQRDYCIQVPSTATVVEISMTGGSCKPSPCIGDDVQIFLKQGAVPDAFSPDSTTKRWTYTPGSGAFGTFGKGANGGGAFYISLIDGANTLGYSGVSMSVSIK